MSIASALLAWTDRLPVGIGVLPVPLRNVALTAMETAALHRLFPGRVTVGVGHGVQGWMGQVGARVESPLTLLGEYLQALRGLLRGERLTVDGRYVKLDDVALDWPPLTPPPVLAAAAGPRTLAAERPVRRRHHLGLSGHGGPAARRPAGHRRGPRRRRPGRRAPGRPLPADGDRPGRGAAARGDGARGAPPPSPGTPTRSRTPSAPGRRPGRTRSCSTPAPTTRTRSPSSGSPPSRCSRCWRDDLTRGTRRPRVRAVAGARLGVARPARRARR